MNTHALKSIYAIQYVSGIFKLTYDISEVFNTFLFFFILRFNLLFLCFNSTSYPRIRCESDEIIYIFSDFNERIFISRSKVSVEQYSQYTGFTDSLSIGLTCY